MLRIGILGGGQLGRMLLQASINYPVETFLMEKDPECPAAHLCHNFVQGDISSFDDVYAFGKDLDAITIEIESVNEEALQKLEEEGVRYIPVVCSQNYQKQDPPKKIYEDHAIPTSPFLVTQNLAGLQDHLTFLPAVHKIAEGGYDGRGVVSINKSEDVMNGLMNQRY